MDAEATPRELAGEYLRPRVRVVVGSFLAGAVVGGSLVFALVLVGWPAVRGARIVFVLAALAFGGGLLGWSGSALAGRGFEAMQARLQTGTDWTERKSRRAMARIGAFGIGAMTVAGSLEIAILATT